MSKKNAPAKYIAKAIEQLKRIDRGAPRPRATEEFVLDAFEVFEDYELDPSDADDWRTLATILAFALFGNRGGRPKIWTRTKLFELALDFARAKADHPDKPDAAICKLLVTRKPFNARYRDFKHTTIRRVLPEARKRAAKWVELYKKEHQFANLTPSQERKLTVLVIERMAKWNFQYDFDLQLDGGITSERREILSALNEN